VDMADVTFEKAFKAFQAGNTMRGGDSSGISVMSAAVGFSGLPTAGTRLLILIVSAAAHLATRTSSLDIYVNSVGVIPIVYQSLINIRQRCAWNCDIKFVVSYNDYGKVVKDYQPHCVTAYRDHAHHLWVAPKVIDSSKNPLTILELSGFNMRDMGPNSTFFGPIFGHAPFKGRHVYKFGLPSDFRSFSSSFSSFCLLGITHGKDGPENVTHNPLPEMNEDEWYTEVVRANYVRNAYFLRPAKQYSSISNVLSPPTKGVTFISRGEEYDALDTGASDLIEDEEGSEEEDYYEPQFEEEPRRSPQETTITGRPTVMSVPTDILGSVTPMVSPFSPVPLVPSSASSSTSTTSSKPSGADYRVLSGSLSEVPRLSSSSSPPPPPPPRRESVQPKSILVPEGGRDKEKVKAPVRFTEVEEQPETESDKEDEEAEQADDDFVKEDEKYGVFDPSEFEG